MHVTQISPSAFSEGLVPKKFYGYTSANLTAYVRAQVVLNAPPHHIYGNHGFRVNPYPSTA